MKTGLWRVIGITLLVKLLALGLIALGYSFFPFQTGNYLANFHDPSQTSPNLFTAYQTWDAQHYLYLASHGYLPGIPSNAFYPLYPFFIRFFSLLTPIPLWLMGILISLLLSVLASMFLYLLAKELEDEKTAFRACLWGLAFPTAFYAGLLYTESLFLCLVTAFFYFSRKGFRIQAAVCAFLLSLTRPTGVLVACAVLGEETKKEDQRRIRAGWRTALDFIGGFVFYLCLMKLWTGDYFAGIHAQRFFVSHNEFVNFIKPWNWLMDNFIQNSYTWNGPSTSFLNRAMFVVVLIALPSLYRAVEKDLFIYTLVLGIVPALLSDLMSYIRYVDVLFPLFILAALKIKTGPMEKILLVGCFLAQAFFLIAHSLNYWVG